MVENSISYNILSANKDELLLHIYIENNVEPQKYIHFHPQPEIALITKGNAQFKIREQLFSVKEGDILLFNVMEPHIILEVSKNDTLEIITIDFASRLVWSKDSEWFDPKLLEVFFNKNDDFNNKIDGDTNHAKIIKKIILEIKNEFIENNAYKEFIIKSKFLEILSRLLQVYNVGTSNEHKVKSHINAKAIDDTLIFINKNITEDITLEQLAKIANMGTTYYSSIFKEYIGVSPWGYITSKRVELAIFYLMNKENYFTITETARLCGFNNITNFNKIFKKITGKSPTEFNKLNKNSSKSCKSSAKANISN